MISHDPTGKIERESEEQAHESAVAGISLIEIAKQSQQEFLHSVSSSRRFKIHTLVGSVCSALSYTIWFFIAWSRPSLFPLWFPIFCLFGYTLSFHYIVFVNQHRDFFNLHLTWFCITQILVLFFWLWSSTYHLNWNLYVLCACAFPLSIHYIVKKSNHQHKKWLVHICFYLIVNALCIFIWLDARSLPWPFFVLLALAAPLIIHTWLTQPKEQRTMFNLHLWLFIDLQLLFFFIRWITKTVPWDAIIFIVWSILLGLHYMKRGQTSTTQLPILRTDVHQPPKEMTTQTNQEISQSQNSIQQQEQHMHDANHQFQVQQLYPALK